MGLNATDANASRVGQQMRAHLKVGFVPLVTRMIPMVVLKVTKRTDSSSILLFAFQYFVLKFVSCATTNTAAATHAPFMSSSSIDFPMYYSRKKQSIQCQCSSPRTYRRHQLSHRNVANSIVPGRPVTGGGDLVLRLTCSRTQGRHGFVKKDCTSTLP